MRTSIHFADKATHPHRAFSGRQPPYGRFPVRRILPVLVSLFCGTAIAAPGIPVTASPTGGQVVGGVGSITHNGARTVIDQHSGSLAIDWKSFNVGKDAAVLFKQPSVNAAALNRILGQNPSLILGKLSSNGKVFLINPHGIIFGKGAKVNVGGLVASTLDLKPQDFMNGDYKLAADGDPASVVNHGIIAAASGGSVSLIGGHVVNDGLIVANYGHINLDGARKAVLDFGGDGLINVQITGKLEKRLDAQKAAVTNKGTLEAHGGTVVLKAAATQKLFTNLVNNSGVIKAGGISTQGGTVQLVSIGGNTVNSGTIDVSGVKGGSVGLFSDQNVAVIGDADIDASGTHGGGQIRVGGGKAGEDLPTAQDTVLGANTSLVSDATQTGNGGSIVVRAQKSANIDGQLSAGGGSQGGNGGFIETSAANVHIADDTRVSTLAPSGQTGTWLIDPHDFTIAASGGDITGAALGSNLNNGDVSIESSSGTASGVGDINVNDSVSWSANTLTLTAARNVNINGDLSATGAAGLKLQPAIANGSDFAVSIGTNIISSTGTLSLAGTGNMTIGSLTNDGTFDISGLGSGLTITSLDGTNAGVVKLGANTLTLSNANDTFAGAIQGTGGGLTLSAGTETLSGTNTYTGTTIVNGGSLSVSSDANLGSGGGLTLDGGTLESTATFTLNHAVALGSGGGTLKIDSGDKLTVANSVTGTGALTLNGEIAGNLKYTGGTVKFSTDGKVDGDVTAQTLDYGSYASAATFDLADGSGTTTGIGGTWSGVTSVNGSSHSDTIKGSGQTYTLDDTTANKGGNGTVSWTSFENLDDTTGTVKFGTGGSVSGNVTAQKLDYTGHTIAPVIVHLGGIGSTGVGGTLSSVSAIQADNDLGVDGVTSGSLAITSSGASSTTTLAKSNLLSVGGSLEVTADGPVSEGSGNTLAVHGTTSIQTGSGSAITLVDGVNAFTGAVSLTGGTSQINNAGALTFGTLNTGNLTVTSSGGPLDLGQGTVNGTLVATSGGKDIGQDGALHVTGASTVNAGSGNITLGEGTNRLDGTVNLTGGVTNIENSQPLTLGTLQTGILTVTSSGDLDLGKGTVGGALTATSHNGAVTQSGALTVTGTANINAGTGDVTLGGQSQPPNSFQDAVSITGGTTSIVNNGALTLGTLSTKALTVTSHGPLNLGSGTVDGALDATSNNGAITQSGDLNVNGPTTIDAGTGTITLADNGNDFQNTVTPTGGDTTLADTNALTLGSLRTNNLTVTSGGALNLGQGTVGGALAATAAGDITQAGALHVGGPSTLTVTGGEHDVTLANTGNDFGGKPVTLDASGGGSVGTFDLYDTNAAALFPVLNTVPTNLTVNYPNAAMTTGQALTLAGALDLTAGKGITLSDSVDVQQLTLSSNNAPIHQLTGIINVRGNAVAKAGNGVITLIAGGPSLTLGKLTGSDITLELTTPGTLTLAGDITASNSLILESGGGITQSGGSITTHTLSGSAGSGGVQLTSPDNQVDVLGGFSSGGAFGFVNGKTITLASVGSKNYTVNAGSSPTVIIARQGSIYQSGTAFAFNGIGLWSAPQGNIGTASDPIRVRAYGVQTVAGIGMPPAYFFALSVNGGTIPVVGAEVVNVPQVAALAGQSLRINGAGHFIDISAVTANYRGYGVVQPGLMLPRGQWDCSADRPYNAFCPEGD